MKGQKEKWLCPCGVLFVRVEGSGFKAIEKGKKKGEDITHPRFTLERLGSGKVVWFHTHGDDPPTRMKKIKTR
jgi:hypothetical protein